MLYFLPTPSNNLLPQLNSCWINSSTVLIYSFLVPLAVCVVLNTILFFIIIYRLHQNAKHRRKDSRSFQAASSAREAKAAMSIFVLLGLSWLFGGLIDTGSSSSLSLVFQYLFSIFTTLQGFFIFVLQCVFNDRVWEAKDGLLTSWRSRSPASTLLHSSKGGAGKAVSTNSAGASPQDSSQDVAINNKFQRTRGRTNSGISTGSFFTYAKSMKKVGFQSAPQLSDYPDVKASQLSPSLWAIQDSSSPTMDIALMGK